ncbi:MAG: hypothetical protein ABR555_04660 [Pyrinomonadaceae bacterium]
MSNARAKLLNVLIGKSIVEILLVTGLAVGFYISAFPPYFHGWGEVTQNGIAGWAVNNNSQWTRVDVQLFIDGKFVATTAANLSRPDVMKGGWSKDEWHGYLFNPGPLSVGQHEARVYALHASGGGVRYTSQMLGDPIPFRVAGDGKLLGVQGILVK